jgi:hypothetical protein
MHGPLNVKSPINASKCQMGFNSACKGLMAETRYSLNELKKEGKKERTDA